MGKKTENKNQNSNQLLNYLPAGVFQVDLACRFSVYNNQMEKFFPDIQNHDFSTVFNRNRKCPVIENKIGKKQNCRCIANYGRKVFQIQCSLSTKFPDLRATGIAQNISDETFCDSNAENKVFSEVFEKAKVGIITFKNSPDGFVSMTCNSEATAILERKIKKNTRAETIFSASSVPVITQIEKVSRTGKEVYISELEIKVKSGLRVLETTLFKIFDDEVVVFFHNITERRIVEDILRNYQYVIEESEQRHRDFSQRMLRSFEKERKKIAVDIHDEIGSAAVIVNSYLSIAEDDLKESQFDSAIARIHQARAAMRTSVENLKKIAVELRPPDIDIIGLSEALRIYFQKISQVANFKIKYETDVSEQSIDENVSIALYRIAQEALNNIIKHAEADIVEVFFQNDGEVFFKICDNGKGFYLNLEERAGTGMGIMGMKERAESCGGLFRIFSQPGNGTEITVLFRGKK